jgi:type I restriction enzyme S subunit
VSVPAYSAYRDSGVDWLGDLPATWRDVPFWALFKRVKRSGFPDAELLSVYRDYGVIRKADRDDNFNNASDDLGSYQLVEPGDLAINKMKAWQGSLGISPYRGIVSPAYFVYHARHAERPEYLHYLLRSVNYATGFMTISKGIRINQWDVDPDQLAKVRVPLPSVSEQSAIAAFLDRETAKIDALVEEQRRLIALLKEKRQAVISHAVTKGLNPGAPMKDSGIEWLGEVPAHWGVGPVKRVIDLATSGPRGWSERASDDGAFFFQSQNIGREMDGDFSQGARVDVPDGPDACRAKLKFNDIVVCITGGRTGSVAHISELPQDAFVNQHVCLVRPTPTKGFGRYLSYGLFGLPGQEQLGLAMYGLKQGLSLENVREIVLPFPPIAEQQAIARFLDDRSTALLDLVNEAHLAITLLQERRAALISVAVTGKIDVRGLIPSQAEAA